MDKCPKCGGKMEERVYGDAGPNPDYAITYPTCTNKECGFETQRISLRENAEGITFGDWAKTLKNKVEK